MRRCVNCDSKDMRQSERVVESEVPFRWSNGERRIAFQAVLSVLKCGSCGTVYESGEELERFDLLVAHELTSLGVVAGGVVRFVRKALGFKAADLAGLLGVTPETISHWENDRTKPDRAAWATLGALVRDRLNNRTSTLDQLKALRKPPAKIPNKPVQLKLAVA